jgi:hypothetical protein
VNVFACDPSPAASARALADLHVVCMVRETAQILSTTVRELGLDDSDLYKSTHLHHPVVVACIHDSGYRDWVIRHGRALAREYTYRYARIHASSFVLDRAAHRLRQLGPPSVLTSFPLAMPEELQSDDPHESYRRCLAAKYARWGPMARWTRRTRPDWASPAELHHDRLHSEHVSEMRNLSDRHLLDESVQHRLALRTLSRTRKRAP